MVGPDAEEARFKHPQNEEILLINDGETIFYPLLRETATVNETSLSQRTVLA